MKTTAIDQRADELFDAAHEFQLAAADEWSAEATLASLARMEQGFLALAASSYEIRGKAARNGGGAKRQRTVALDEMAAAFAGCARRCRDARAAIRAAERSGDEPKREAPKLVAL
jgi:hypothetical protein